MGCFVRENSPIKKKTTALVFIAFIITKSLGPMS